MQTTTGERLNMLPIWPGKVLSRLADLVKKEIKVPVAVTNDANAAAMGEMVFGGAKKMKDFIVLTLGTGLGSGIVVDGKLVYGHTGFAGEVGHMIVVPGRKSLWLRKAWLP